MEESSSLSASDIQQPGSGSDSYAHCPECQIYLLSAYPYCGHLRAIPDFPGGPENLCGLVWAGLELDQSRACMSLGSRRSHARLGLGGLGGPLPADESLEMERLE